MINRAISIGIMFILSSVLTACVYGNEQLPSPTPIPNTPIPITTKLPPPTTTPLPHTAESPTPTPRAEEFILAFFNSWNEAVSYGEIEETLSYFGEDATLETIDYFHLVSTGKDEIRASLEHWINSGYLHMVGQYKISTDDDSIYWSLESDEENAFCYGKVTIRGLEIVYLGYSTC